MQIVWGTKRRGGPRPSRLDGARGDARLAPGNLRGLRPLPVPRRPARFIDVVQRFIDTTEPAEYDQAALRAVAAHRRRRTNGHRPGRHPRRGAQRDGFRRTQRHLITVPGPYSRVMGIDVTVLRVFTDPDGQFRKSARRGRCRPGRTFRPATPGSPIGLQRNDIRRSSPAAGATTAHATIYTPRTEIPFAGHPTVGASWWLREKRYADQHAAGAGRHRAGELRRTTSPASAPARNGLPNSPSTTSIRSTPFVAADPADFPDDIAHYLWTWTDRSAGSLRARMFAANLGVPEDEATGSAAMRITDYLSRDLTITQGKGSMIETTWSPEGWVRRGRPCRQRRCATS